MNLEEIIKQALDEKEEEIDFNQTTQMEGIIEKIIGEENSLSPENFGNVSEIIHEDEYIDINNSYDKLMKTDVLSNYLEEEHNNNKSLENIEEDDIISEKEEYK